MRGSRRQRENDPGDSRWTKKKQSVCKHQSLFILWWIRAHVRFSGEMNHVDIYTGHRVRKGCPIIWWKWKSSICRRLNKEKPWKSKWMTMKTSFTEMQQLRTLQHFVWRPRACLHAWQHPGGSPPTSGPGNHWAPGQCELHLKHDVPEVLVCDLGQVNVGASAFILPGIVVSSLGSEA